jgi:NAD(P)-dependent dehydrogenase (short-subunit alcohol dehydrogenase family)
MQGLAGKTVVVAGGAGGIGTATSVRLGSEGANVVVGDLDGDAAAAVVKEISNTGGTATAAQVDISDEGSVQQLVDLAVSTYGGIDAFHANAADLSIIGQDSDILDVDLDIFDRTIKVNLRGHVLCTRAALPHLLTSGGALVYTTSAAAYIGEPERPSYAIAKAGITALVRHVASKWGKQGIRANAIAPGLVLSPNVYDTIGEEFQNFALAGTRSQRLGYPDDIAGMVAFLVSADGAWINGQVISVDGGATLR